MKKICLLVVSLLILTSCSSNTLSIDYKEKGEVDFCELNDDCDFTKEYESVKIKNLKMDDKNIDVELKKVEDKQALFIAEKEITDVYKVKKISIYKNTIIVDSYYNKNNCEGEGCRTLLAFNKDGDLVQNLNPRTFGLHYTIGGAELLSLFVDKFGKNDYYVEDDYLYVMFTSMDGESYVSRDGDYIDICDKDVLKSKGNVVTFIDSEKQERFVETITSVFKFKFKDDYTIESSEKVYSFVMENAIFKYCVEDAN